MILNWTAHGSLCLLGAVAGLVGDHIHVDTHTTPYADTSIQFIASSPLWFPFLTGLASVLLADLLAKPAA